MHYAQKNAEICLPPRSPKGWCTVQPLMASINSKAFLPQKKNPGTSQNPPERNPLSATNDKSTVKVGHLDCCWTIPLTTAPFPVKIPTFEEPMTRHSLPTVLLDGQNGQSPIASVCHPENCAFGLCAFEMGGSGSSGEDPFCTPTDVQCMPAFPYNFL